MNIRTIFLATALATFSATGAAAMVFHIAMNGNDEWSGRLAVPTAGRTDGPFRTFERARNAVRELRKSTGNARPMTIRVHAGIYNLTRTLELGPADGGAENAKKAERERGGERKEEHRRRGNPLRHPGRRVSGHWKT